MCRIKVELLVRCGGVGERAIAGERERMGGRKEEKEKKRRKAG
jgi:hypothetical protein